MNDLGQLQNLTFTTEPKTRRHLTRGAFISGNRAAEFMQHLWEVGLKKLCRYEVLEFEFIQFFGTNDKRTIERYIGRPEQTIRSKGSSTVRINRTSGKVALFDYSNNRKICRKQGLLENLGYITLKQEERSIEQGTYRLTQKTGLWIAVLHHERMSYYTEQTTLETANLVPEVKEESDSSIDEMCVSGLLEEKDNQGFLQGKECEKTVLEVVSPTNIETVETNSIEVEKKEEVIDSTHTNQSSESEHIPNMHGYGLAPEAETLLRARSLRTEPDRSKTNFLEQST